MSKVIIDTNVIVVANRQNSRVFEGCAQACVNFVVKAHKEHVVLIDSGDEIRGEYAKALKISRPMGLGALFLLHVINNQFNQRWVQRVDLDKGADGEFLDFPKVPELANFDKDDRKFASMAKKTGIAVSNAIDSDWADSLIALNANGINVDFLCGCEKIKWFVD